MIENGKNRKESTMRDLIERLNDPIVFACEAGMGRDRGYEVQTAEGWYKIRLEGCALGVGTVHGTFRADGSNETVTFDLPHSNEIVARFAARVRRIDHESGC